MKRLALHWQILIGIVLGVVFGLGCAQFGDEGRELVINWVKPFGTIFINLLKLIAIPLIVVSLVKGISDLKDVTHLSKLGLKTFGLYIATTVIAVSIGLLLVNAIQPGGFISEDTRGDMLASFGESVDHQIDLAKSQVEDVSPLQPIIDIVPENIIESASSNTNMLQVIFISVLLGVALISLPIGEVIGLKKVFDASNAVMLKIVDIIMLSAPYGVFAIMAAIIVEVPSFELFKALGAYGLTVVIGLLLLIYGVYALMVLFLGKTKPSKFYKAISPAQLLAFSTSSSAATLPVTMECVEKGLGVRKNVLSFVLPIGATINMDGTCLYQGVAAIFIAQVLNYDLTLAQQLSVILTATLASIGSAAVPGAGILMLVIVLESIGVPPAGIALIFAIDRPLDMLRTTTNVTGDAVVSLIMNRSMKE